MGLALGLSGLLACATGATTPEQTQPNPSIDGRTPVLTPESEDYARLEDPENSSCASDTDCVVGGCSGEVCTTAGGNTESTCEVLESFRQVDGASCGCVASSCQWYR